MSFAAWDAVNNWLAGAAAITKMLVAQATVAYLKRPDSIGPYQAYMRSVANDAAIRGILNAAYDLYPPGELPAARLLRLYAAIDQVALTVTNGGNVRLGTEQAARHTYWTAGAGSDAFPDLQTYVRHGWLAKDYGHLSTPHTAGGYIALLGAVAQPFGVLTVFNVNNEHYRQAVLTAQAVAAAPPLAALAAADGSLDETKPKWQAVVARASYWESNKPRVAARRAAIQQMENFVPAGGGADAVTLIRTGTLGEKDDLVNAAVHVLRQGPASFEREKWFFTSQAVPGPGIVHPYRFTLTMRQGAMALLANLAVPDGQYGAVVTKAAEPNCYGFHEDALPGLHRMVRTITVRGNNAATAGFLQQSWDL